jgi:G:T-mismatch repair DNA endonuclease (very short patch repair protein)
MACRAWNKGKKNCYSEETIKKMSDAKKGCIPWNRGLTKDICFKLIQSDERKRRISSALLGKKKSKEHVEHIRLSRFGKHSSETSKEKNRLWHLGRKASAETLQKKLLKSLGSKRSSETKVKMSVSAKERIKKFPYTIPSFLGRHHSEVTKQKLREITLNQNFPLVDTCIEIDLQNILKENNIVFEKQKSFLGTDFKIYIDIFIAPNICIFADGCYWHACKQCLNENNFTDWQRKRILYDTFITQRLIENGYIVLRFAEHSIKRDIYNCFNEIQKVLSSKMKMEKV